jgi:hypothetical protein
MYDEPELVALLQPVLSRAALLLTRVFKRDIQQHAWSQAGTTGRARQCFGVWLAALGACSGTELPAVLVVFGGAQV